MQRQQGYGHHEQVGCERASLGERRQRPTGQDHRDPSPRRRSLPPEELRPCLALQRSAAQVVPSNMVPRRPPPAPPDEHPRQAVHPKPRRAAKRIQHPRSQKQPLGGSPCRPASPPAPRSGRWRATAVLRSARRASRCRAPRRSARAGRAATGSSKTCASLDISPALSRATDCECRKPRGTGAPPGLSARGRMRPAS